ncbi:hypothetical protein [uncultured Psychroserpens sp.]|uniref:hypothetical protein n=1 Tax=uncultured Psychroserpens sp. TaxID=255436 RepID=UPI00260C0A72|nr:hypothetical protein [uncultured Psychroserpens sp.]
MRTVFLLLGLFACFSLNAQDKVFPDDYLGVYKGDLVITSSKGKQSLPMEFHLKATDSTDLYSYKFIVLVNNKPSEKNYTLKVKDKSKGEFLIDENNGIVLNANYIDNTLYSVFDVESSLITTTETFYENKMEFKIVYSDMTDKTSSDNGGDAVNVTNYPVTVIQKAILTKQ